MMSPDLFAALGGLLPPASAGFGAAPLAGALYAQAAYPGYVVPQAAAASAPAPEQSSVATAQGQSAASPPEVAELAAQAMSSFLQGVTSDLARKFYDYLQKHAEEHPSLEACIPLVGQAVVFIEAGDYVRAFNQCYVAYLAITAIRLTNTDVPAMELT